MAIAAIGLFFVGYQWGNQFQRTQDRTPSIEGIRLRPAITLPEVALHDAQGALAAENLRDQWSLIAFGSPGRAAGHRAVARMLDVWNRLADRPALRSRVRLLLISADDAPRLARDFEQLSPALRVLSTSQSGLETLRTTVGAGSTADASDADEPPPLFLLGPSGQLVALFPGTQPAQAIAADLGTLSDHWRPAESSTQPATPEPKAPDAAAHD